MWWVAVGVMFGWCGCGGGGLVAVDVACCGYVGGWRLPVASRCCGCYWVVGSGVDVGISVGVVR